MPRHSKDTVAILGIDIGKNTFLVGLNKRGAIVLRPKLSRPPLQPLPALSAWKLVADRSIDFGQKPPTKGTGSAPRSCLLNPSKADNLSSPPNSGFPWPMNETAYMNAPPSRGGALYFSFF